MKAKTYDQLKWVAQYLLPAMGTLYFVLSSLWGLPNGEQVVGTITALDAFLGALLGVSSKEYNKSKDGTLMIDTSNATKDTYRLSLDIPLEEISGKDTIKLNVDNAANLNNKL